MTDPLAEMLLEAEQGEQAEKTARTEQLVRIETLLGVLIEEFRALNQKPANGSAELDKKRSITVTGRDENERIKTVELN